MGKQFNAGRMAERNYRGRVGGRNKINENERTEYRNKESQVRA
jgi:hypothetical protein